MERLILVFALFGIAWLILWVFRVEHAGGALEKDASPFAMRPIEEVWRKRQLKKKK